jgi:hypothetical protein
MKAALIAPKGYYNTVHVSNYHLALAQIDTDDYLSNYAYEAGAGDYVIVDNGAAEGSTVSDADLIIAARNMSANEVVVPDVMRDCEGTINRVRDFLDRKSHWSGLPPLRFMLVVQGLDWHEVQRSIDHYMNTYDNPVLGIPRHFLTTLADVEARIHVLKYIARRWGEDTRVHLLGTNPVWPKEVKTIGKEFPWVRGVDSSMPYNYAIAGFRIDAPDVHMNRPGAYFTADWTGKIDNDTLSYNIDTFLSWARGA